MITFHLSSMEEHLEDYREYAAQLRLIDTYWEDNIWFAQIYEIRAENRFAGCFSLLPDSQMLTSFFLLPACQFLLRPAFRRILEEFAPRGAYVVSNDEPFLCVCSDIEARLVHHAYFFDHTPIAVKPPAFPTGQVVWAEEADRADLEQTGFYHPVALHNDANQIYVLRDGEGRFLGTGHIARMRLCPQWGCVGMYTAPEFRRMGAGRSLILAMIAKTKEQGLIPIAGCKYENRASRHTLQSCGMISKTRYLNVFF